MEDRVRRYIEGLRRALDHVSRELECPSEKCRPYEGLIDASRRYLFDAEYYLNKGDLETALASVSYAEGLLDSLKYLGVIEPSWEGVVEERRVFVGGTFDLIHPGHVDLLEYASRYGKLYVVVARDENVERIKGRRAVLSEVDRLRIVSSIRFVYKALLGDKEDFLKSVERVRPHVIVLGPDQPFNEEDLARELEKRMGYRPEILRFPEKRAFSGGKRGSSDLIAEICSRTASAKAKPR